MLFPPNLMYAGVERLKDAMLCLASTLPANIRLGWKGSPETVPEANCYKTF
jgi:hypothetical protein